MKKNILFLITICFPLFVFSQEKEEVTFKTTWKNSMKVESSDGMFKLKFGGRVQSDWVNIFESDEIKNAFGESAGGIEFRRVRMFSSGQIYNNVKYKLQFDFGEGVAELKDAYIMLTDLPVVGFLQIGRFKEPIGFDELTSSKYITFMERALIMENVPSRNAGIMIGNSTPNDRLSFRLGVFKDTDDFGNSADLENKYNITGRVFGLPIHKPENNTLLHLGAAYSYRSQQHNKYKLSIGPESHMANDYLTTGVFTDASNKQLIQSEAVFIHGPLFFKSEVVFTTIKRTDPLHDNFKHTSFYGETGWFLTGESKGYEEGEYQRVKPKRNFDGNGGLGAWEVAFRYSSIDLNDQGVNGGALGNITCALNWYLNPATRIMINYINSNVKNVGQANIVQMRFGVDF